MRASKQRRELIGEIRKPTHGSIVSSAICSTMRVRLESGQSARISTGTTPAIWCIRRYANYNVNSRRILKQEMPTAPLLVRLDFH